MFVHLKQLIFVKLLSQVEKKFTFVKKTDGKY